MRYFALDTSALSKRYHLERGTPWMMNLFEQVFNSLPERLVISRLIISEVVWVLKRRLNTHTRSNINERRAEQTRTRIASNVNPQS